MMVTIKDDTIVWSLVKHHFRCYRVYEHVYHTNIPLIDNIPYILPDGNCLLLKDGEVFRYYSIDELKRT